MCFAAMRFSSHQGALGRGEGLQDVLAHAGERALVARLLLAPKRAARLGRSVARVHRHGGLLIRVQNPIAILLWELPPRLVHVVAQGDQDVAQILAMPCRGPRGDGALADAQRVVGHHRAFRHVVDESEPVTGGARSLSGVGGEVLGVQHGAAARICAGARVQHAQQVRQGRDAPHRGARTGAAAMLLERDGGREPVDRIDIGHAGLIDETSRIGRDRLEISALRLGVQRTEGQRGLSGAGYAGEHDECVARQVQIDVLQIVLAGAADADETIGWKGLFHASNDTDSRPRKAASTGRRAVDGPTCGRRARLQERRFAGAIVTTHDRWRRHSSRIDMRGSAACR